MLFKRLALAPKVAWEYSQRHPLEAFCYGALCIVFAWGAKIFLSILAMALMGGAISQLLNPGKGNADD